MKGNTLTHRGKMLSFLVLVGLIVAFLGILAKQNVHKAQSLPTLTCSDFNVVPVLSGEGATDVLNRLLTVSDPQLKSGDSLLRIARAIQADNVMTEHVLEIRGKYYGHVNDLQEKYRMPSHCERS
jgi:hypothetical protein